MSTNLSERVRAAAEKRFQEWKANGPNTESWLSAIRELPEEVRAELGISADQNTELFGAILKETAKKLPQYAAVLATQKPLARKLDALVIEILTNKKADAIKHAFLEAEFAKERLATIAESGTEEDVLRAEIDLEAKELQIRRMSHTPEIRKMFDLILGALFGFTGGAEGLLEAMLEMKRQTSSVVVKVTRTRTRSFQDLAAMFGQSNGNGAHEAEGLDEGDEDEEALEDNESESDSFRFPR